MKFFGWAKTFDVLCVEFSDWHMHGEKRKPFDEKVNAFSKSKVFWRIYHRRADSDHKPKVRNLYRGAAAAKNPAGIFEILRKKIEIEFFS